MQNETIQTIDQLARRGGLPGDTLALQLADVADTKALTSIAAALRDEGFNNVVTYSRKVFIPLTHLCRDVCHYCTFAQVPRKLKAPYMSEEDVLEIARNGAEMGCKEALFTLGEKPELRFKAARDARIQIPLAKIGDNRCAGKLPIGKINAKIGCRDYHLAQKFGADLMTKAA